MNKHMDPRVLCFVTIVAASLIAMLALFLVAMRIHYQSIDYEYLVYASSRMVVISVLCGLFGLALRKRRYVTQVIFGVLAGPAMAAVVIFFTKPI